MAQSPLAPHASTPAELQRRIDAERTGRPFLLYRDGAGQQRIVDLEATGEHLTIGRRESHPVALDWDPDVSRVHAELERVGGDWTITDDGLSRNGTFVDGERVVGRRRLRNGNTIRAGGTVIAFCAPASHDSEPTAAGEKLPSPQELSETQRKVLIALCRPYKEDGSFATPATNQGIADELYLSVDAVKTHLRALFHKFGVQDLPQNQKRTQLVWRALQSGVVSARELWE